MSDNLYAQAAAIGGGDTAKTWQAYYDLAKQAGHPEWSVLNKSQPGTSIVPSSTVTPSSSLAGQTFAPLLDTLHSIGRPTIASYAPVAPRFEGMAPVPITRPGNDYYQNLFNAKFSPLNQEYFGEGGTSDKAVGEANRRGFLTGGPSGVAGQLYSKTVTEPFARATADIQNQVNIIKTETEMDLAKYDAQRQDEYRKFQADLLDKDRLYGMQSAEAQSRIDNTYLSLESEINQAIAKGATDEELANLNARVNTYIAMVNSNNEMAKLNEERLRRQGEFYLGATGQAGGLAPQIPFGPLDVPIPYQLDKNGNAINPASGTTGTNYSSPPAGYLPSGTPIRLENPGSNGAPNRDGAIDNEKETGTDGRVWTWNRQRQMWTS